MSQKKADAERAGETDTAETQDLESTGALCGERVFEGIKKYLIRSREIGGWLEGLMEDPVGFVIKHRCEIVA